MEHAEIVLVPADAFTGAEGLQQPIDDAAGGERDLETADHEGRAFLIGEHHGLFDAQLVAAAVGVILDEAGCRVRIEPLAYVTLVGERASRELGRGLRAAGCEASIQSQLITDHDQRGERGGADIIDGAA